MSAKTARQYHFQQSKIVVDSVSKVLNRINPEYTPNWLLCELEKINHVSQCILAERRRILKDFGELDSNKEEK